MSNNQYENFKTGVKNDVRGLVYGLFAGVGLFSLIMTIAGVVIWFCLKVNHYNPATKATVGVSALLLVVVMVTNKQVGNFIYLCWLKLLLIAFILICIGLIGLTLYAMYFVMKDSF